MAKKKSKTPMQDELIQEVKKRAGATARQTRWVDSEGYVIRGGTGKIDFYQHPESLAEEIQRHSMKHRAGGERPAEAARKARVAKFKRSGHARKKK